MTMSHTDAHAPVVQLLLTVSFSPPIENLTILDLASVAALFRDEFPVFQQIARAGPMSAQANADHAIFPAWVSATPRISMSSTESRFQLLFQNDRLSFGWVRGSSLDEPNDYPGFTEIFENFETHVGQIVAWAKQVGSEIRPAIGEIVYTDAFPLTMGKPLSDIITLLNPIGKLPVNSFNYNWTQPWPNEREGYVEGLFAGPGLSPEGTYVATLETSARFEINAAWDGVEAAFKDGHAVMKDIYEQLVKPPYRATSDEWE